MYPLRQRPSCSDVLRQERAARYPVAKARNAFLQSSASLYKSRTRRRRGGKSPCIVFSVSTPLTAALICILRRARSQLGTQKGTALARTAVIARASEVRGRWIFADDREAARPA